MATAAARARGGSRLHRREPLRLPWARSTFSRHPRRRLDYLRLIGASKESAKELKLFGLAPFITSEFSRLSDEVYEQNVALARRRLLQARSSPRSVRAATTAPTYVIYRTVNGDLSWGSLQFLAGALLGASGGIQLLFSTFSSIADQSLFLTDLAEFLKVRPSVQSRPHAIPAPRPMKDGIVFEDVSFLYPGNPRLVLDRVNLRIGLGERIALVGANGQGKTTLVKLLVRRATRPPGAFFSTVWICASTASRICIAKSASSSRISCATT